MSTIVKTQTEFDAALAFDLGARIARLTIINENGCWVWQGSHDGRYGQVSFRGETHMVHRASLAATTGGFRPLDVDHLCRTTLCVNPAHLEWVTHAENEARKPHRDACKHGHPYTEENTHIDPRGHRRCRECNRLECRRRAVRSDRIAAAVSA